ncbi:hypothetical protein S40285_06975 [Stachybotrys chlorohalonatus IBT 40285]|uniref:Uncharacterized protein n=1 Tax=Stachybotrys chlorohalonatus (strain IBT 40285) TaxID=1283841 RepID=A0A084QFF4_STAC4|nr:hypothetical protein S40285_06975 [Stachybotrys chlorohalonata IBT 40285]
MPGRLHLASGQPSIIIAPPSINLRRAAAYNAHDRGPLSSSSSRFSFNHLIFSPPPSPSLPALVPRPKSSPKKILSTRPPRPFRVLAYLLGLSFWVYVIVVVMRYKNAMSSIPAIWPYFTNQEFEMVGLTQDALPDFPTPLLVSDDQGQSKWTVYVPHGHKFPLSTEEYSDINGQCREVSARTWGLHNKAPVSEQKILSYDAADRYFVDVFEAEKTNLLPAAPKGAAVQDVAHFVGVDQESMFGKPVCEASMTFVLESNDAGLGNALMLLWTFYGLAQEQGRAFFIDDTRWAYGNYGDIFQLPPIPDCQPPPTNHIIPCPFQARHLAVSSATAKEIFPAFLSKHHRLVKVDDEVRDLFGLARTGYEALFSLNKEDGAYVKKRIKQVRNLAKGADGTTKSGPVVGMHVRRGDRHPLEYQYRNGYIPTEVYLDKVEDIVDQYYNGTSADSSVSRKPVTLLASDDPTVLRLPALSAATAAQERIQLASKEAVRQASIQEDPAVLHQFVDETFGWEGGFYAPMFWNLGVDRKNNAANAPTGVQLDNVNQEASLTAPPSKTTLELRSLIGRAYMMDLAVLAGASDTVVCAVSASGCRLLGVMMGWGEGIEAGRWVNVDGTYGWAGINW